MASTKTITIDNIEQNITITRRKGAKRISMSIRSGSIYVAHPWYIPTPVVMLFIHDQKDWIKKHIHLLYPKKDILTKSQLTILKKKAMNTLIPALQVIAKEMSLTYKRVSIGAQSSLWGSCSSNKNLHFNYKIQYLPSHLLRYLIIHELAHLVHLNHSANFWALVESYDNNFKMHKKELKTFVVKPNHDSLLATV
jgi:predicted metal-dependent hydrolase